MQRRTSCPPEENYSCCFMCLSWSNCGCRRCSPEKPQTPAEVISCTPKFCSHPNGITLEKKGQKAVTHRGRGGFSPMRIKAFISPDLQQQSRAIYSLALKFPLSQMRIKDEDTRVQDAMSSRQRGFTQDTSSSGKLDHLYF